MNYLSFVEWLKGNIGEAGDYSYGAQHLISFGLVILVCVLLIIYAKGKAQESNKIKVLKAIAIFQLSFEVILRLIYLFVKHDTFPAIWPMYPCNLAGIIIPLACLLDNKIMKKMFYLFGFIGGVLTFFYPNGIFSSSFFVFPILKSVLQHTGLVIIPIYEYALKKYRPSLYDYPYIFIGLLVHLLNCEVIDRLLGLNEDYLFLRSGLPFVIPGVPKWITISIFAQIVILLMCYFCDIKKSKEALDKLFKKKS